MKFLSPLLLALPLLLSATIACGDDDDDDDTSSSSSSSSSSGSTGSSSSSSSSSGSPSSSSGSTSSSSGGNTCGTPDGTFACGSSMCRYEDQYCQGGALCLNFDGCPTCDQSFTCGAGTSATCTGTADTGINVTCE